MSDLEHRRTQPTEINPDIAHTTEELKANYARPSVLPPEANKDKTRRVGHLPLMIGVGAAGLAATIGLYLANQGDGDPTSGRPTESTSALPNTPENSQGGEVTADPKDLSDLDTPASAEQIKEALKPVTSKEYATADKALVRIGELWNVNMLSAEIDPNDLKLETPQSVENHENIYRNIFGDNYGVPGSFDSEEDAEHMRHNIAGAFDYAIEQMKSDPHWNMAFAIDNVIDNGDGSYTFSGSYTVKQDLSDKVGSLRDTFFSPEAQQSEYSYTIAGSLELTDDVWHLQSINFS